MWRFIGSKFIASLQFRPNWRKIQIHPHLPKLQASPYRKVQILNLFWWSLLPLSQKNCRLNYVILLLAASCYYDADILALKIIREVVWVFPIPNDCFEGC